MTREKAKSLQQDFLLMIFKFAEEHDLKYDRGSCTYQDSEIKLSATLETKDAGVSNFMKYCSQYGLQEEDHGRTFKSNGKNFTIDSIDIKKHKFPIICICVEDGKQYKFEEKRIKILLMVAS